MTDTIRMFRKDRVQEAQAKFEIDQARLDKARNLIEACQQNGAPLGLSPEGDVSVAHIAASAPDCALLLALYEVGAPLEEVNNDLATPAHVIALRMVTEIEEGRRAASLLSFLGVRFTQQVRPDVSPAIAVVEEDWPTWSQQWNGWKEMNARKNMSERLSTLELFLAYWRHRRTVKATRRFLRNLG